MPFDDLPPKRSEGALPRNRRTIVMEFKLNDEQELLRYTIRVFTVNEIAPFAA